MKPNLVIFCNVFPDSEAKSENWLNDELRVTSDYFNKIFLVPNAFPKKSCELSANSSVVEFNQAKVNLNFFDKWNSLGILFSDFKNYPSKINFLKAFRYNYSLLKSLHSKANNILDVLDLGAKETILYAYWADNLATMAAIIKKKMGKQLRLITRGHGFEIFEEQTHYGVIPFRSFQYKYITKIYADSVKGLNHLNGQYKYRYYKSKNSFSYVGTFNSDYFGFDSDDNFTIVTCSFIRNVKRLELMPRILENIKFNLTWHVLGAGEDLQTLIEACKILPKNIKVNFHGALSNKEVLAFYENNNINLFVSLSSSEGLPVSMMEAQSFGIPIMSTDVGGCSEICKEETGQLIKKNFDANDVAEQITNFKNSAKNSKEFRLGCRKHWEMNFNAEKNYQKFAEIILKLQ